MKKTNESGQILIIIVLGIVGIFAVAALAVDGGQLFVERRASQNAADNAALAAAYALCAEADPATAALASAANNGFDNDGTSNTVTLNNPPASGPNSGDDEFSEAIVNSHKSTFFAQIIGLTDLPVTTRAVSRCRMSFEYAVIALNNENSVRGIEIVGGGDLIVNNGAILSNSTHPTEAIYENSQGGGAGQIVAEDIHAVGGVSCPNCTPAPTTGVPSISDPLATLPPPTNPGGSCIYANYSGSQTVTLNPGLYCELTGDSNVDFILNPGIYYIDGPGAFAATAGSTVSGDGVMIYLSPSAGASSMSGNADVNISGCDPLDAGAWCVGSLAQYAGMLFYADRNYTQNISMTGNSTWNAVGTIYAAGSFLDLSGNGAVNNLSSMVVADTIRIGGSSDVVVNYLAGLNVAPPTSISLVE